MKTFRQKHNNSGLKSESNGRRYQNSIHTSCTSELTAFTRSFTLVPGKSLFKSLSEAPFG